MKKLIYAAGILVAALCVWFFAERVIAHLDTLRTLSPTTSLAAWLVTSLVFYVLTFLPATASWRSCLFIVGQTVSYLTCLQVNMISQFAKFLPGNVGQHIGRVVMMRPHVTSSAATFSSMLLDMILLTIVAICLSMLNLQLAIALWEQHVPVEGLGWLAASGIAAATLALLAISACFWPAVQARLRSFITSRSSPLSPIREFKAVGLASVYHCISFIVGAGAVCCIIYGLTETVLTPFNQVLGAYSLAWLAGFLLPGAPAGIGIRELVLVLALGPGLGEGTATATALLLRVITTIGDGAALTIGLAVRKFAHCRP